MGGEQAGVVMTEVGQPEVGAQLRQQYELGRASRGSQPRTSGMTA